MTDARKKDKEALASWLLEQSLKWNELLGADVLYNYSKSHTLSLVNGEPEENSSGESEAVCLRVIAKDGRQGLAHTNNFSRGAMNDIVEWSRANCEAAEPEEHITLYGGAAACDDDALEIYDPSVNGITPETRMKSCADMHEIARSADGRVVSVRSSSWSDGVSMGFYATTAGLSLWRKSSGVSCGAAVVMSDGDAFEMGGYGRGEHWLSDIDCAGYARKAVDKTAKMLGGKPLDTGRYTLLIAPDVSADLMEEIGELFCASDIHKGRSMMRGKLGQAVAGSAVTLTDDARLPRRLGSASFDCEGVPTGRIALIEAGVASNYLYNLQYAAKDGVKSTGSASRGFSSLPDVGTSNLVLSPGTERFSSLVKGVSNGFLVLELLGTHTIDPVSGDFSLGAKGTRISGGELGEPVSGVTISGNLVDFIKKITAVGGDQEVFGSTAASTLVVEDITVAGN
ncbi:peptidase C69 [Synergistales bacterium]|nr:peptidase C69 [Synergistales bacterium]